MVNMIVDGKITPGERLVQSNLAKKFKVSQSLIRETLLDLQVYGLVETIDNRGIFVRKFDAKTLLEMIDVRELLEGQAARQACEFIQDADIEELNGFLDAMYQAADEGDHVKRAEIDRQFHDRINFLSGNYTIHSLAQQFRLFSKVIWTDTPSDVLRSHHEPIMNALRQRDPNAAETAARNAVKSLKKRVQVKLAEGGEGIYWLR